MDLYRWLPPEGVKIALVLSLSFLIGLARISHRPGSIESSGAASQFFTGSCVAIRF